MKILLYDLKLFDLLIDCIYGCSTILIIHRDYFPKEL
jgi:hypothetical protein